MDDEVSKFWHRHWLINVILKGSCCITGRLHM